MGPFAAHIRTLALICMCMVISACGASMNPSSSISGSAAVATPSPVPAATSDPPAASEPAPSTLASSAPEPSPAIRFSMAGWRTDFTRHSVDLSEILAGGPPRDGIPPIDEPQFESVQEARGWLLDRAPIIALEIDGDVRGYPIAILLWHEIANDVVGGTPVVVTFCPLCNTAIVFDRRAAGQLLDFGTTGNVRMSDLVMWDRQTESWWQQITGEAIVGTLTSTQLRFIPAQIVSLRDFALTWPEAMVLSRDTGHVRRYGVNPYPGYDEAGSNPFLFDGIVDGRLAPKERVVAVAVGDEAIAFPFQQLRIAHLAQATVGNLPVVVFWTASAASPLDRDDVDGRNIGAVGAFDRRLDGQTLTFRDDPAGFVDAETGSLWTIKGMATSGPMEGRRLTPIVYTEPFWFAWAAFEEETTIWTAGTSVSDQGPTAAIRSR